MPKFVFGKISILFEGANFADFLNEVTLSNIKLEKVERKSVAEMQIVCKAKDCLKIVAILNKRCYTIKEQKTSAKLSFFKKSFLKLGLLIGVAFGIMLNVLGYFFVWDIKFYGDKSLQSEIEKILGENGIGVGTPKFGLKAEEIENILRENLADISLANVSFRGTTMLVSYTKRTSAKEFETAKENILAKNDGVIASISVLSGQALVKPGDFVKRGQILIQGGQDENGQNIEAKGQVFAYIWKSATIEFPLEKIVWARTDNFVLKKTISLFGKTVFEHSDIVPFEKFEEESETKNLCPSGAIPLKVTFTKIFELEKKSITQNFEEMKDKLFSQAKLVASEQVIAGENVLEEKTETNFVSNIWFVTHYIKIKEKIS